MRTLFHPEFITRFLVSTLAICEICAISLPQEYDYEHDDDEDLGLERPENLEERTTSGPEKKDKFLNLSGLNTCGLRSIGQETFPTNKTFQTQFGDSPWMAAIYADGIYVAAATLIRNDVVITAAYPIKNTPEDQISVVAGDWDRLRTVESKPHYSRGVRSILIHEQLALFLLDAPFFGTHISPICLPLQESVFIEESCRTIGWGQPSQSLSLTNQSDILWFRNYAVMTREDCRAELPPESYSDTNILCGADLFNEFSPHNVGGGLFCFVGRYVLAGLALSGKDWEPDTRPALFLNISPYVDWIKDELVLRNFTL
ncbi:phenoloxidase-activating factor 2-like [Drosophila yakuba]|uniref:phenoloxidase-activating factor 2-like n=1 Tax=Drosophila yakuba TaxID=7245 RepID=UPI001930814C|nr:phenoloxidase-activating factor 2-like [Drosophila yakuba]